MSSVVTEEFTLFAISEVAYNSSMCSASSQCATSGAVCLNNLCVCDPTEHFFKNGACVNSKFCIGRELMHYPFILHV